MVDVFAGDVGAGAAVDKASDVLGYGRRPLDALFLPRSVAVIGATEKEGSVGRTVLWNLISSPFGGTVFPINPKRPNVLGLKAYPSLAAVPDPVELAVIVTPPQSVPGVMDECVASGVRGVIVISAGFKETGPDGEELERQVLARARAGGIRVIGPNCLGVMNPIGGLNATFAAGIARPGSVGLISQSGALLTAILDWSMRERVGFSSVVSLGSMLDVGWGDVIYHLGDDRNTGSIVIYMETVGDARAFLSAAREVALTKPIIVIKPGRTAQAAKAAASHTGSLTGSDEVLDAAFRRVGVLRVDTIEDLFAIADVLAKQPRPRGRRLSILTNAGGPGVLATDALIGGGGQLTEITPAAMEAFNAILPAPWSHNNPVDIIGDAPPERYAAALDIAAGDPGSDGLMVILTPQAMTDPTRTAEQLVPFAHIEGKPVLASWMGGADVEAGTAILRAAGIPTFPYPDGAAEMFNYMWRYSDSLHALYETPTMPDDEASSVNRAVARDIIDGARREGRTLLTEFESKQVLSAYAIPITETRIAPTEAEAVAAAEAIGYPVVLKLHSHTITHKTDVGGVQLNLVDADAVRAAYHAIQAAVAERRGARHFEGVTVQPMINYSGYELIVGSSVDAQFGPVLLFGMGGQLVELFRDRALALPPLTTTLARRMIERTRIYGAFAGIRGRQPIDVAALEQLLVHFGQLVVEQPWIKEIDINPLLASPERLIALDARVVLHDPDLPEAQLPRLAIRPYPRQYVGTWRSTDGTEMTIRPIRPEDEPLMVRFHGGLSERTVYERYLRELGLAERTGHERLTRVCFNDYDREIALVVERAAAGEEREIVAVGRLSKRHALNGAEFAIVVADCCQRTGLGTELLRRLVQIGRDEALDWIGAEMLADNVGMRHTAEKAGFTLRPIADGSLVRADLRLRG
ncbi:MAG TPA: bifunctional acetate--CoA ligase family protein/GNAT family N-acetyltransferase [Candidatus Acidoferrales bacterium]|nr:bifunctional acetate--CoA ligase family protein/GNAT family N-acetyltransferase [Candidatus Acidoferrales bacterium]